MVASSGAAWLYAGVIIEGAEHLTLVWSVSGNNQQCSDWPAMVRLRALSLRQGISLPWPQSSHLQVKGL